MIGSLITASATSCLQPPAIDHSPARDAALRRMVEGVGRREWSMATLKQVAGEDADLLFPGGIAEVAEAYFDLADRDMLDAAHGFHSRKLSRRVRAAIMFRLTQAAGYRPAVRHALSVLMMPGHARLLARSISRSVNAIWTAAGDDSQGVTYMTKRASLAGIYVATLLFWLARGGNMATVEEFLDRRLANIAQVTRLKNRLLGRPF
ncbi:COQ9 family protein [Gluconacetobacter entanii]|uniref:COQ9 family protein n=1 Tax=Gluconacetobacter entanii TaxID=108528 RepID=A0ABT3K6W3_9PROT|nr:COQ9 family protein [Gluconacetobacter entanii]MBE7618745.1 COQ9 family protein [Komagataeibacter sp. FXV2]MCW4591147.1 COQ9 family protein [Gluconacetobacter entanii]MCW4594584.1 COQ9 family protein [Gluconacetobacter entanii]NPC87819.1 COQ9 family protein [Gluconacetobacter entanii]